jgi:C-terminal region of band_7
MLSAALGSGSAQAVNYFVAQEYIEALAAFARSPNQKTLVLPVEAAAVPGSLAGIGELARGAFGARGTGREGRGPAAGGPWAATPADDGRAS